MAGKVAERRKKLRERLIDIAQETIRRDGLSAIRARSLAEQAGAALGAIYNVFADLNDLVLEVNGRTFQEMGEQIAKVAEQCRGRPPEDRLVALSLAYLAYAEAQTNAWTALFEVEMTADADLPEWYLEELRKLFAFIAEPVAEIFPDFDERERGLMVRALFSSVHGMVLLGLQRRISAVPREELPRMIELTLRNLSGRKPGP